MEKAGQPVRLTGVADCGDLLLPAGFRALSDLNATMIEQKLLHEAFRLLSTAELGLSSDWAGPDDVEQLRSRVEVLAVLLNIVPRNQLGRFNDVLTDWHSRFAQQPSISIDTLRKATHAVLRDLPPDARSDDAVAKMRRIEAFLEMHFGDDVSLVSAVTAAAKQQCALGLFTWQAQFQGKTDWTSLPGVVPGDPRIPIQEIYVELYACPQDDEAAERLQISGSSRAARGKRSTEIPSIGVDAMVARTLETCVVIGEPGSGKSTVIQWLAWAANQGQLPDFDFALVVRLKQYADALEDRPKITPVEFFLESLIPRIGDWKDAAECLRQMASRHHRVLLLLDGWDEVGADVRDLMRQRIQQECSHFVVVLTSRASGLPWQIFPNGRADHYEIAGLSGLAIRSFVEKQLQSTSQSDLTEQVIASIERDPDLMGMAANPFVLGMLVRVLCRPPTTERRLTFAELFHEITNWIVEHHRQSRAGGGQIVGEHLKALEALSYSLIYDERSPRYVFRRQELDEVLGTLESDPVLDSRFVNRLDSVFDRWGFLHATFEEYFAARHMAGLSKGELNRDWDQALCSQSRLVALEFLVGLQGKETALSSARAEYWLENPDRFGLVYLRLARLAISGQWTQRLPELGQALFEKLWGLITGGQDWRWSRLFVETFALLDPLELVHRAASKANVDSRICEAISDLLPLSVIQQGGLLEKLPKNMREHLALRARSRPPQVEIDRVLSLLADDSLGKGELPRLLDEAALIPDPAVAVQLLRRLQGTSDEDLSTTLVMGLSPLFGLLPKNTVIELLTEQHQLPPTIRQLASATLSHDLGRGQALDPSSRDCLLRRLAVLQPQDDRVGPILDALAGFPIRDGGELIAQLAIDRKLHQTVRIAAVEALGTVSDLAAIRLAVAQTPSEHPGNVLEFLVELAAKRHVAVPLKWLEAQIEAQSDAFNRRALLTAYIRMVAGQQGLVQSPDRTFLVQQIQEALQDAGTDDEEHAWTLANALRTTDWRDLDLCDPDTRLMVEGVLQRFVARQDMALGQVRLAASLLRGQSDEDSIWRLRRSLDTILQYLHRTSDKRNRRELESVATEIAEDLARVGVGQLLDYPADCDPVREALAGLARESGWIIFADRILDADGNEVANLNRPRSAKVQPTPEEIAELLKGLDESPRKAILSFWLMTRGFGLCDLNAGYKQITAKLLRVFRGQEGTVRAMETIREVYPEEIPETNTWRTNIARAVKKLECTPNGVAFLNDLGLPRH